jgi:hypothetical protein
VTERLEYLRLQSRFARSAGKLKASFVTFANPLLWLTTMDIADAVVSDPEFNRGRYDPKQPVNLTTFLFGGPGRKGQVEMRLIDYLRMKASQAGLPSRAGADDALGSPNRNRATRRPIRMDEERLGAGAVVEAIDPLQAVPDAAAELIRELSEDETDVRLISVKQSNPDASMEQLAEQLKLARAEIEARLDRMQQKAEARGLIRRDR